MQPTMEILERLNQNSKNNNDEVFTKLFRYMLREDIYYVAYKNLYANNGAATNGINTDTADGFSTVYVRNIIQKLKDNTYEPNPVRRVYIPKRNGKKRPLGIPTFTDKLVQEVLRMILEAVYEPVFLDVSHGFRPNRGCHTALTKIKKEFNGTKWFIEGDIKGCFDNINHIRLIEIIGEKIKDARLIQLIYKFLKAGYLENWQYNNTYSGAPQGGIVSPILTNIYLHELDKYIMGIKAEFDKPAERKFTKEYIQKLGKTQRLSARIKECSDEIMKAQLINEWKTARAEMLKTPSKSQTDKKLKYIRYADDLIVAVNGSKEDCEIIKIKLKEFISTSLKMELSEEKTYITHSNTPIRFLGYDIRIRRSNELKRGTHGMTQRTMNYTTELTIPLNDKIIPFLFDKKAIEVRKGVITPCKRPTLLSLTDLEIVNAYNAEIRGICNYYSLAVNYSHLNYFSYLMEYSCLKTLAAKYKTTISKIIKKYSDRKGGWCIPYDTKQGKQVMYLTKSSKCKGNRIIKDNIVNVAMYHQHTTTKFEQRLKAKVCEICGNTDSDIYEIHHVKKVKDLKGKELWERIMIAKRRKTIVVCRECHKRIHGKKNFD